MKLHATILAILCATTFLPTVALAEAGGDAGPIRRFALVAGNNDGGEGRSVLRYAVSDARSMASLLSALGGVEPADLELLVEPDRRRLQAAIAAMTERISAAKAASSRTELVVYYSGHSDADGLLLGPERFGYQEFREALGDVGADVRIAILDSCAAGNITRLKGGKRRPAFLMDTSVKVKGHAYLASSSADEAAQESDQIGASYFTHYLVSGLRGAADLNSDGRITLNEAYQFAYGETLASTESTRAGAQHAAFDIELAGTGDLVITDLRGTAASLSVAEPLSGRVYLHDEKERLVVEMRKESGRAIELGLDPGTYRIRMQSGETWREHEVALNEGDRLTVTGDMLTDLPNKPTALRGSEPIEYRSIPVVWSLFPGMTTSGLEGRDIASNFVFGFVAGRVGKLDGMALSIGANWIDDAQDGLALSAGGNFAGGVSRGAQFASGGNVAAGSFTGVQGTAGLNYARSLRGVQFSGGVNAARDVLGGQWAGGVNLAYEQMTGAQFSVVNIGGAVDGAQFGVVNIATGKVRGTQVGVFNYADDISGVPVGLVNVVRKGQQHFDIWSDDVGLANLGFRLGSKHFYTSFNGGWKGGGDRRYRASLGFGAHIPFSETFFTDLDLMGGYLWYRRADGGNGGGQLATARLLFGLRFASRFAVFAGPTFNAFVAEPEDTGTGGHQSIFDAISTHRFDDDKRELRMWPGLVLGFRI